MMSTGNRNREIMKIKKNEERVYKFTVMWDT